jgi:hypothetical protein
MTYRQLTYLPHRITLLVFLMLVLNFLVLASTGRPAAYLEGCPLFPADNVWNTPVDDLPVDSGSNAYISTIGANRALHPDFGSGTWAGGPIGIPYTIVDGSQPEANVDFDYAAYRDEAHHGILIVRLKQPTRLKIHRRVVQAITKYSEHQRHGLMVVMPDVVQSSWKSRQKE